MDKQILMPAGAVILLWAASDFEERRGKYAERLAWQFDKKLQKIPDAFFWKDMLYTVKEVEAGRILENKGSAVYLTRRLNKCVPECRQGGEEFCCFFNPEIPLNNSDLAGKPKNIREVFR